MAAVLLSCSRMQVWHILTEKRVDMEGSGADTTAMRQCMRAKLAAVRARPADQWCAAAVQVCMSAWHPQWHVLLPARRIHKPPQRSAAWQPSVHVLLPAHSNFQTPQSSLPMVSFV